MGRVAEGFPGCKVATIPGLPRGWIPDLDAAPCCDCSGTNFRASRPVSLIPPHGADNVRDTVLLAHQALSCLQPLIHTARLPECSLTHSGNPNPLPELGVRPHHPQTLQNLLCLYLPRAHHTIPVTQGHPLYPPACGLGTCLGRGTLSCSPVSATMLSFTWSCLREGLGQRHAATPAHSSGPG